MSEAIEYLGGQCKVCGATSQLEIDHIDPKDKSFTISKSWGVAKERFIAELAKCQLLCKKHHLRKTVSTSKYLIHGTYARYHKGCRCDDCRAAEKEARARW